MGDFRKDWQTIKAKVEKVNAKILPKLDLGPTLDKWEKSKGEDRLRAAMKAVEILNTYQMEIEKALRTMDPNKADPLWDALKLLKMLSSDVCQMT